jgi:hypothetical protein
MYGFDGCRTRRSVELEANLEGTHVLLRLFDEHFGCIEIRDVEGKRNARLWIVLSHASPQQRYGAD